MDFLQHITIETAGIGGNLTHDYFNGKKELRSYYNYSPDMEGIRQALHKRQEYPVNRQLLYDELHKQYSHSNLLEPLKENIQLLLQENTYTVTTGHQLNLFTGPLYFIYKIASIISLTKRLSEEIPGYHFIPVYWMNSEDHDFAEINHFYLKGEKYEWNSGSTKLGPVGRMALDELKDLLDKLELNAHPDENFSFIINMYRDSSTLAEAHREIVNKLFGKYGVLILDQDSAALKNEFSRYISREIFEKTSIPQLEQTNQDLESLGYKPQVFARQINFFYTGNGSRERIVETKDGFGLADGSYTWSKKQLQEELKSNPGFFSPNVVTRPMYQEFLLPNIAYVGGPAEIAYLLQYKSNFEKNGIFYPVLVLRDCFLILEEKKVRKIKEWEFQVEDFFKPLDAILNQYIKDRFSEQLDISGFSASMQKQYSLLFDFVCGIDSSMGSMVKAAEQKSLNELDKIGAKMNKALKTKNEHQLNMIRNIHAAIFPQGTLQERIDNLFEHCISSSEFIDHIINLSNPLDPRLKVLED